MIIPQIPTRIRGLHHHLLPLQPATRERQFITSAAPARLVAPGHVNCRPSVTGRLVHRPRTLSRTHECVPAAVATGFCVPAVVEGSVVLVACLYRVRGVALTRPGTRGFAAVPIAGGFSCAGGALGKDRGEEGKERKEDGEGEMHFGDGLRGWWL